MHIKESCHTYERVFSHEGGTGGASKIVKEESSGKDPKATGGLISNLPHPRVNTTKQHTYGYNMIPIDQSPWPLSVVSSSFPLHPLLFLTCFIPKI